MDVDRHKYRFFCEKNDFNGPFCDRGSCSDCSLICKTTCFDPDKLGRKDKIIQIESRTIYMGDEYYKICLNDGWKLAIFKGGQFWSNSHNMKLVQDYLRKYEAKLAYFRAIDARKLQQKKFRALPKYDADSGSEYEEMDDFIKQEIEGIYFTFLLLHSEFRESFLPCQGKYEIFDKIGEGSFSSVYLAVDLKHYEV